MTLNPEVSVGDILTFVGLIVASVGLFLNFWQMMRRNREKRAEFLINLYNQYYSDKDVVSMFYEIEEDLFKYDNNFHQLAKEQHLDKLLCFFDNIAKLWQMKNIRIKDVRIVGYDYLVVYQNTGVQQYLAHIDKWCRDRGIKTQPYEAFRELGAKLQEKEENGGRW